MEYPQLRTAAEQGDVATLKGLVQKRDINLNSGDKYGLSALHKAVWAGKLECVEVLLSAGADKDVETKSGETPLHKAAQRGRLEIAKALLESGANKDRVTDEGKTPFTIAVENGQFYVAELLEEWKGTSGKATSAASSQDITKWSVDEVAAFIDKECEMPEYKKSFVLNKVDGKLLAQMDQETLSEVGVSRKLDRIRVLNAIKEKLPEEVKASATPTNSGGSGHGAPWPMAASGGGSSTSLGVYQPPPEALQRPDFAGGKKQRGKSLLNLFKGKGKKDEGAIVAVKYVQTGKKQSAPTLS